MAHPPWETPEDQDHGDMTWPPDQWGEQDASGIPSFADFREQSTTTAPFEPELVEPIEGELVLPQAAPFEQSQAGPPGFVEPTVVAPDADMEFAIDEVDPLPPQEEAPEDLSFSVDEVDDGYAQIDEAEARDAAAPPPPPTADMSAYEFAQNAADREDWRAGQGQQMMATAQRDREVRVENEERRYQEAVSKVDKKQEEIAVAVKELSAAKVDPGLGTISNIFSIIAATLGGYMSPYYGGRNPGLEQMNKLIAQNIETQKFNIQNKRTALGEQQGLVDKLYEQTGDMHQSLKIAELSMWEMAKQKIMMDTAELDPRGTKAQKGEVLRRGIEGTQMAIMAKHKKEGVELQLKIGAQDESRRAHLANEDNTRKARWQQARSEAARIAMQGDAAKATREKEQSKEARKLAIHGLKDTSGNPIVANSIEDAKAIKAQIIQVGNGTQLIHRMFALRKELGAEIWTAGSAKGRVAQGLHAQLLLAMKDVHGLGILSKSDEDILKKEIGGDPGSFVKDPTKQLESVLQSMTDQLRMTIKVKSQKQTVAPKSIDDFFDDTTPGAKKKAVPLELGETQFDEDRLGREAIERMAKKKGVPVKQLQRMYDVDQMKSSGSQTAIRREFEGVKDVIRNEIEDQSRKGGGRSRAKTEKLVNKADRLTYGEILEDRRNTGKSTKLQRNRLTKIMKRENVTTMKELAEVMKTGRLK